MAQVKTAQMSNDRLKNANATSGNNSIKSVNKMKTRKFKSLVIWVDHKNLEVKDLLLDDWSKAKFIYQLVKHQRTYHIGRSETGFSSKHRASLILLLANLPFCKVSTIPEGEYGNSFVEVDYQDDLKIAVEKGVATISAKTIDDVIGMIRSLRYANHLGTDYKVIKQGDDSAVVRFNKINK